ncbi:urease accessory protein UreE [Ureaplasma zalophigenitalium]|uniref:Urease accessory protein UreE n=1 Tax=Ureaplasma zalophigenitalium TaxID=907723 RepID=A0ABT3BPS3_9BACT|nr:urease accessory protein UreE [Ureaplasma zalophigenitalium]MCV3754204.1 urease accessory protein UreE [Ureaplasma zalophigenitalium]
MTTFKKVINNVHTLINTIGYDIENIYLTNDDALKRVIIAKSELNNEYGIKLEEGKKLVDGDILLMDEEAKKMIVVRLEEADVLEISPATVGQMAFLAHNIGNRHTPAQFTETSMIIPYDYLIEEFLQTSNAKYERKKIKLKEAFRHSDAAR